MQKVVNVRKWSSILIFLLLVLLTGFVIAGCSGGGAEKKESSVSESPESSGEENAEATEGEGEGVKEEEGVIVVETKSPKEEEDPTALYVDNCGACHGHDGSGVVGPAIKGTKIPFEQMKKIIASGKESMPQFQGGKNGDELTEEQISIIIEYVKGKL